MNPISNAALVSNRPRQANTDLFDPKSWSKLANIMSDQKFSAGQLIFSEGESADKLYYLKSGRVKITKCTTDGKMIILHLYGNGDMFGHIDVFQESVCLFSAEAIEDCHVGIIQQQELELALWQHGELAVEFMKWMGAAQRVTETKFRDLMLFGKPGALCSTLIRLCNTYGKPIPEGILISEKLTHSELADIIGATRESVNRILQDLKKSNVLTMMNGCILIIDLDYLKAVCRCDNCPSHICRI